jgi:hypothetical protein
MCELSVISWFTTAASLFNPLIVDGQIRGGVVHGIGNVLFERMIYDEAGQPLTTTYGDYFLLLASEMPSIEIHHMETPSPRNPIGVKGAGEGGTISRLSRTRWGQMARLFQFTQFHRNRW